MGTERFAVVEISAAIPLAIPGVLLDVLLQLSRLRVTMIRKGDIFARARQSRELGEHIVKKEGQPNAFAASLVSDAIHAVIPIATTHQWESVSTKLQPMLNGAHAMLIERGRLFRTIGQIITGFFFR